VLCSSGLVHASLAEHSKSFTGAVQYRTSSAVYIPCSVPQGSVLGPRLFILYTADLDDHVAEHGVSFHAFADDTQLYVHCRRDEVTSAVLRLELHRGG